MTDTHNPRQTEVLSVMEKGHMFAHLELVQMIVREILYE